MTKATIIRLLLVVLFSMVFTFACSSSQEATPEPEPAKEAAAPEPTPEPEPVAQKASEPDSKVVLFEFDSSQVNEAEIRDHIAFLSSNADVRVTLEGHCDIRGSKEYNNRLGERRAKAVQSILVQNGVGANRITVTSYGKSRPAAPGNDESAHAKNRRVQFVYAQ